MIFVVISGEFCYDRVIHFKEDDSVDMRIYFWIAGAFLVGNFIYSIFGMQIGITKKCALKFFTLVKNDSELWYPDACFLYLKKIMRRNRLIITAIFLVSLFAIPLAGSLGLFIGYFFKMLTTSRRCGINGNNLSDCVQIFQRFSKQGKEDEFSLLLEDAATSLQTNNIYKCF